MENDCEPYPLAPYVSYTEYAHLISQAAEIYPQKRYAEVTLLQNGLCYLCAHGLLAAGLCPEKMVDLTKEMHKKYKRYLGLADSRRSWKEYLIEITSWTGERHPLLEVKLPCPSEDSCSFISTVNDLIVHLYDDHRWTLQQVTQWLFSLDEEALQEKRKEE